MVIKKVTIDKIYDFKKSLMSIINKRSPENYYEKKIELKDETIYLYIYEKYYFRINSNLSVSVIVNQGMFSTTIEIIASGGNGSWLEDDWGAEENATNEFYKILIKDGFKEVK